MAQILIIDDDSVFRLVLNRMLVKLGHSVTEADSGMTGLKALKTQRADLIFCDLVMPDKEGIETIIEVRAKYPEIKIIAMSGGSNLSVVEANLRSAAVLGATKLLLKPFSPEELQFVLQNLIPPPPPRPSL